VVALIAHMVIATKGGGYTRHGCPISAINEAALLEFLKLADAPSTVKAAFTGQSFIKCATLRRCLKRLYSRLYAYSVLFKSLGCCGRFGSRVVWWHFKSYHVCIKMKSNASRGVGFIDVSNILDRWWG
jgi:hypothetical protein